MANPKILSNVIEDRVAKLAVLIDADNASPKDIENILDEITKYGEATVKRIYGNFVNQNGGWKQAINNLAIKPMQQFAYTTGKNATDGFMIIDAMDLLYKNRIDGFVIVSSDSDFTALAIRIKEEGANVYGFGKEQTPESFRNACSQFTYVENLTSFEEISLESTTTTINNKTNNTIASESKITKPLSLTKLPLDKIKQIFDNHDTEWISVASLGSQWKLLQVDFDPRTYGYKKLGDLVKADQTLFEVMEKASSTNEQKNLYVKLKKR